MDHVKKEALKNLKRLNGVYNQGTPGPVVILCAGVHGNEPAGVAASNRVIKTLQENSVPLRGSIHSVIGNLRALDEGVRYIDQDLNRLWKPERMEVLESGKEWAYACHEDIEQQELYETIQGIWQAKGPAYFIDLHSTSSETVPFSISVPNKSSEHIAKLLPVCQVHGLVGSISGGLFDYVAKHCLSSIALEGGENNSPETINRHESMIWLILEGLKMLGSTHIPDFQEHRRRLTNLSSELPSDVNFFHAHKIHPEDQFRMHPDYKSFQALSRGEVIAEDRNGLIQAPEDCRVLLPLYQQQGDDGFFLVKDA